MKQFSFRTKIYLCSIYAVGIVVITWRISQCECRDAWLLFILCGLASLGLISKVQGPTPRSHYTFSLLVYGFTFALYGTSEAIWVVVISHLVEWIWSRPPWFVQLFNCSSYGLLIQIAGFVNYWINPASTLYSAQGVLALAISMGIFDLLNHLTVGIVLWLARNENFARSGVFDFFPLMLDLSLLYFGASLAFVWNYNGVALLLASVPIYVIYRTLRIPFLERQTMLDSKTGLFNDKYFKQQLHNELNRANRFNRPLAVIMADLDLLRNINNTYGHLAGDEVLIGVASILKQSTREYDIVSRFGGEEFAIVLPETTMKDALAKAENIRKTIEETEFVIPTNVGSIRATMSFGIACREDLNQTQDEIINHADAALYQSKLSGRNRVYTYVIDSCMYFVHGQETWNAHRQSIFETSCSKTYPQTNSIDVD